MLTQSLRNCRFAIADYRFIYRQTFNRLRQSQIGNQEAQSAPRDGTDLTAPNRPRINIWFTGCLAVTITRVLPTNSACPRANRIAAADRRSIR
jgi:hypothetical protein